MLQQSICGNLQNIGAVGGKSDEQQAMLLKSCTNVTCVTGNQLSYRLVIAKYHEGLK